MLTRIGSLEIRNPVILASGVLGDSPTTLKAAYNAGAGAVITKSITIDPRQGRPEPNIIRADNGGWLNAIGLENPGAKEFARILGRPDYPVIVSLAGSNPSDFKYMIGLFDHAVGFELNLSCPNVDGLGDDVGDDSDLTSRVIKAAKSAANVPVFVKIGHHMAESAKAAVLAGADGITAINTVPATAVDHNTREPVFGPRAGGLSGPPIKPIALRTVHDIVNRHSVPVIGCGGISTWRDAAEFMMVGAVAVQVGSAAMDDLNVLGRIADGLSKWSRFITHSTGQNNPLILTKNAAKR